MVRIPRRALVAVGAASVVLFAAACGSSSSSSPASSATGSASSSASSSASATTSSAAIAPASGPGLTSPSAPSGTRVSGGTVYFTEGPDAAPNYIFPMYTFAVCSTTNVNQLMDILYRPLYWYGNNYSPTVDYDYSIGQQPVFSNGNKTVTIHLNTWKWSDGEAVTSRDLAFWMNVIKASPSTEWCGYAPGYFPDNVIRAIRRRTRRRSSCTSTRRTTPSGCSTTSSRRSPAAARVGPDVAVAAGADVRQRPPAGHDQGRRGGRVQVPRHPGQGPRQLGDVPLWSVVDGPFKLQSFTTDGQVTLVPNPRYSGSPKPTISKLVELPFTSEAAIYNEDPLGRSERDHGREPSVAVRAAALDSLAARATRSTRRRATRSTTSR